MKITYLTTVPKPKIIGTDAIYQEIDILQKNFGGELHSLFPFKRPNSWTPRFFYGVHNYSSIKRKETQTDAHHLFTNGLHWFPVVSRLKKPKILSLVASVGNAPIRKLQNFSFFDKIIVSNSRDEQKLIELGLSQTQLIRPGLKLEHISDSKLAIKKEFRLLMASAPWEDKQFYSKGVDFLLRVLSKNPHLRLTLLWRGILQAELIQRLKSNKVLDRVEFVDKRVDVNEYIKEAHATVLIAQSSDLVKTYPHSLVESLVGGKPVITSQAIPIADYVKEKNCGLVINDFNQGALEKAIETLMNNYDSYSKNCGSSLKEDFSVQRFVKSYTELYSNYGEQSLIVPKRRIPERAY